MGCTGPKSLISVRSGLNFLDLTVQQIEHLNKTYDVNVPLVLMNSFNTEDDTKKILRKYNNCQVDIKMFNQHRFPRINKETLLPVATKDPYSPKDAWYPPGHGDFYMALYDSGLIEEFKKAGKEIVSLFCEILKTRTDMDQRLSTKVLIFDKIFDFRILSLTIIWIFEEVISKFIFLAQIVNRFFEILVHYNCFKNIFV